MNTIAQAHPLPTTIGDYLLQLRQALAGADPAMIQDALYDAEDYLRSELAEQKGKSEAEVIAGVASSYGAPEEVAEIYRETEVTVARALRPPVPPKRASWIGTFFGVAADPRTYGALFYMLLSLLTGVFYFTWVVTGTSLSVGMLVLIIGVPLLVLFFGSVRVLSLVEGRVVETLLGVRMPRRPQHPGLQGGWLQRIGTMFTDARTWSTMLYFLLMLPLGILYFTVFCTLLSLSLGLAASPIAVLFDNVAVLTWDGVDITSAWLTLPLFAVGVLLLFVTLHLARAFGKLHGMLAKQLLVKSGEAAA
ncbi:sensor domain-containing protein [Xanthomonas citri pv. anacardii]|uniref:sensor domain-containing protein n=1 Tax=Xanthomonas citri TaxID=346 RepID=UPI000CCC950B|nr:sensor domain-containing protein [Xanthomonas citri]MCT8357235.1 sensor domain-containing protein [Xanthomonas citri pv. anacardii]MCT8361226.1 sensor domain-containing protein [Xanthomonas citri pv. anacardii]MCT8365100.1 sensor domain-containing protein [Xanthomonas citri pv. anacardii]MCT8369095.1 sensor domain-containing protein [Xanthomonas citri pv. anacardii]MCT8373142.1 sensor domain-containing protein [Xanthomonas citri pv. anacardii]